MTLLDGFTQAYSLRSQEHIHLSMSESDIDAYVDCTLAAMIVPLTEIKFNIFVSAGSKQTQALQQSSGYLP